MSLAARRILMLAAGVVAGLIAWPLSELLIREQMSFPSYLVFIVVSGTAYGALFGLAFGSIDGIAGGVSARKWVGLVTGAVFGAVAGGAGAVAGQAIYFAIGQAILISAAGRAVGLALARGLGWAVMGLLLGASEGVRLRSGKRAGIGALGGLIGGLVGGLLIESGSIFMGNAAWVRPVGSVALGLFLAGGFAAIERGFLLGSLVLVTGPLRGREYPLPPGRTTIGRAVGDSISLGPYDGVAEHHALVTGTRAGLSLARGGGQVLLNEQAVEEAGLKFDDVIDVGTARFVLKTP